MQVRNDSPHRLVHLAPELLQPGVVQVVLVKQSPQKRFVDLLRGVEVAPHALVLTHLLDLGTEIVVRHAIGLGDEIDLGGMLEQMHALEVLVDVVDGGVDFGVGVAQFVLGLVATVKFLQGLEITRENRLGRGRREGHKRIFVFIEKTIP